MSKIIQCRDCGRVFVFSPEYQRKFKLRAGLIPSDASGASKTAGSIVTTHTGAGSQPWAIPTRPARATCGYNTRFTLSAAIAKGGEPMLTLIATILVWAIIQAVCAKEYGPLLVIIALYAIFSLIAKLIY